MLIQKKNIWQWKRETQIDIIHQIFDSTKNIIEHVIIDMTNCSNIRLTKTFYIEMLNFCQRISRNVRVGFLFNEENSKYFNALEKKHNLGLNFGSKQHSIFEPKQKEFKITPPKL